MTILVAMHYAITVSYVALSEWELKTSWYEGIKERVHGTWIYTF